MKKETRGRKPIPVIESSPYSSIIFLIASGINYPEAISKGRSTDSSSTVKQLDTLKELKFLNEPHKEKLLNKTIYSVNWKKIIEEFVKYMKENLDYVSLENERLGLNLKENIKGYEELVKKTREPGFEKSLEENPYLIRFFQEYYAEIGKLKEGWTIIATFDFLSFFGSLNFVYRWKASHMFYSIERAVLFLNQGMPFPDWLKEEKEPKTEEEEFKRFKKVSLYVKDKTEESEKQQAKQLKEILNKNKEIENLYILSRVLEIVKIKPSLQIGLDSAINKTGKEIFLKVFSKEQLKEYFNRTIKYSPESVQEKKMIEEDLKEIIGENDSEVTKSTENTQNKSRNTHQNKGLYSENNKNEN